MKVWKLIPMPAFINSELWLASSHVGAVTVEAESEFEAREQAAKAFSTTSDSEKKASPWQFKSYVSVFCLDGDTLTVV